MSDQFKYLFTPVKVGSVTVRNRIVMTAHTKLYAEDGMISERHAHYYAERAKGGIGLIVAEQQSVHPTSNGGFSNMCYGYREESIPRYKLVADMVHQHGATIFAQIWHCGQHAPNDALDDPTQSWAPSQVPCVAWHSTPKEMEIEDIKDIIEGYAKTARNAQLGGIDGVEVHAGHSYLPEQFWSPLYNRRTDAYGGSLENRMRFSMELIERVREVCGRDFVLGFRVSGDELFPTGLTIDDMQIICKRLEDTGLIDFINVSGGCYHTIPIMVGPMEIPPKPFVPLAAAIKEVLERTPVFVADRINDPRVGDQVLADGHADMVAMTRATLCDPELPNKAREGRVEEIRFCMACNQACIGRLWNQQTVTCVQNPAAGREKRFGVGTLKATPRRRRVVVIGGGVAGMKAAEMAAERGHDVELYEKDGELGGQVNLARMLPTRDEFWECVRYLRFRMERLPIRVQLGSPMSAEAVIGLRPDVVIVATGAVPLKNGITSFWPYDVPGWEQDNVLTVEDVLCGRGTVGNRVVVYEDTNHHRGVGICEWLADRGHQVEAITRHPYLGEDLVLTLNQPFFYKRFFEKGIVMTPHHAIKEIRDHQVVAFNVYSNQERILDDVDTVVMATMRKSEDSLYHALKGRVPELHRIGDCVQPRLVTEAIWEGFTVGREI